ncbi:oligosaccharide flippase family protein [Morganella morganii]|uniref:oligosaccharide flippase family protein n=2 Tax=Morganella morganii TaxID=582 RepID=UPI002808ED36|nr:oligosaccharide flippase family protein [Morganella morganii]UEO57176.1 flippase [Morganella morganii]HDU8554839.1 oligosaccharide flippase family protein [Morganella morganii]HEI8463117.1 oligosaccharide flippase family protein [Morganella morganii]HEJ0265688.1 oligosaccharide flippase family protein [Morganella morganii]
MKIHDFIKKAINTTLFKNSFALLIIKFVDLALPLIVLPFLSRNLSIADFGLYIVLVSIFSISFMITDFGFGLSTICNIVNNRKDKKYIQSYVSSIIVIKLTLVLFITLFTLAYLIFIKIDTHLNILSYILIIFTILFQALQIPWFFQGIEKMKTITITVLCTKLSFLFVLLILFNFEKSINIYLVSFMLSTLLSSILYIYFYKRHGYTLGRFSKKTLITEFKYSFTFFLSRVSTSLSSSLNSIVIATFSGLNIAAFYGASEKLYNASVSSISPITQALYPYLSRTKNIKLLIKISIILFSLSSITCVFIFHYSNNIIALIFGSDYIEASHYLNLFLILIPINILSILWGYPAFSIIDRPGIPNITVIVSSIIYLFILSILYLSKSITVDNIIYSIITIDCITFISRIYLFIREYKRHLWLVH